MAARTAVVAGTATAVSGRVAHRQAERYGAQEQQAAAPPAPASGPAEDPAMAQLQNLGQLHAQGVLTDEEFAAAKAKILGL